MEVRRYEFEDWSSNDRNSSDGNRCNVNYINHQEINKSTKQPKIYRLKYAWIQSTGLEGLWKNNMRSMKNHCKDK